MKKLTFDVIYDLGNDNSFVKRLEMGRNDCH